MPYRAEFHRVYLGALIYILALCVLELICFVGGGVWVPILTDAGIPLPADIGILSVVVTLTATLIAYEYFRYIYCAGYSYRGCDAPDGKKAPFLLSVLKVRATPGPGTLIVLMALIVSAQLCSSLVLGVIETIASRAGYTTAYSPAVTADYTRGAGMILYGVIIGPMCEELVWRGFVMRGLRSGGKRFAIVTEALLFSLMHGDITQLFFAFVVGIILGYVAMEYSLYASYLLHVFNNGCLGVILGIITVNVPGAVAAGIYILIFGTGLIITLYALVKYMPSFIGYAAADRAPRGAFGSYMDRWFIIYVIFELFSTALTFRRI